MCTVIVPIINAATKDHNLGERERREGDGDCGAPCGERDLIAPVTPGSLLILLAIEYHSILKYWNTCGQLLQKILISHLALVTPGLYNTLDLKLFIPLTPILKHLTMQWPASVRPMYPHTELPTIQCRAIERSAVYWSVEVQSRASWVSAGAADSSIGLENPSSGRPPTHKPLLPQTLLPPLLLKPQKLPPYIPAVWCYLKKGTVL